MKNLSKYREVNATAIKLLLIAIFSICIFYLYFVSITVNAIIENRQNIKSLDRLGQEYQKIETQYLFFIGQFDMDYARLLGFVDQNKKSEYVTRQSIFALYERGI